MLQNRRYQTEAIERTRDAIGAGKKRVLIVSPTGSGKTVIASKIITSAQEKGSEVLFLAHRKELIDQCSAKLDDLGVDHGIIMANHQRTLPWLKVQVASVQTLVNRHAQRPPARLIFIDEAHHARAKGQLGADLQRCQKCFATFPPGPLACPNCGFVFPVDGGARIVERDGEAMPIEQYATMRDQIEPALRAEYHKLAAVGEKKGFKPGWVVLQFRDRYGEEPRPDWVKPYKQRYAERQKQVTG